MLDEEREELTNERCVGTLKEKKESQLETKEPTDLKLIGGGCTSVFSRLSHNNFTEY